MKFVTLTCLLFAIGLATAIPTQVRDVGSESSPNPIAALYPNNVTGTINSTIAVVPIPYHLARSIIPAKYRILKTAYESLLPGFPKDSYPVRP